MILQPIENDPYRALIVDNEPNMRTILQALVEQQGFSVRSCTNGLEAKNLLEHEDFDLVITDLQMPEMDGLQLLKWIRAHDPSVVVIMITAFATVDTAVRALKVGAFDYITKPFDLDEMKNVISKAVATRALPQRDYPDQGVHDILPHFVGHNPTMQEVLSLVRKVASSMAPVLITGESGTGKGLIAAAIHELGTRKNEAFIQINCAAIPEGLLESELFGYEKGAFTGAIARKAGRFELADRGTVFLDEIGEIRPELQVKLLRVLQEKTFERVGGIDTIHIDTRLVAATNRDLKLAIQQGAFREDLFYRLNVIPIHLPALRQRRDDIPLLIEYFNQTFSAEQKRPPLIFSEAILAKLMAYQWPGNIRELENVIERLVVLSDGPNLTEADLPTEILGLPRVENHEPSEDADDGLKQALKNQAQTLEKELILRALEKTDWNVTRAARLLSISRKTLQTKMRLYGLRDR